MDLTLDPFHRGMADPNVEGLFSAKVAGTNIAVSYSVDLLERTVSIGLIGDVS